MARVYMITEPEMQGLLDQLQMTEMIDKNLMIGGHDTDDRRKRYKALTPDERNRLSSVHRSFHMICTRWAQEMGFKGGRV